MSGLGKFLRRIRRRIWKRSDEVRKYKGHFTIAYRNLRVFSNTSASINAVYRHVFIRKIYDFKSKTDSPFIIDAGANIGLATLYWKSIYPNARIIAFEPSKKVFEFLRKNVEDNGIRGVECVNKALSNTEGEIEFTTNEGVSGSIVMAKNLPHSYKVGTVKLSVYITEEVELLKIDIEGAELDVLREIQHKLFLVNRIFVEYHSFVHRQQELSQLLHLLEDAGFRYYIEGEGTVASPFCGIKAELGQDMKLNIWAVRG